MSFNGVSFQSVSGGQVTKHNFDEMPEIKSSRNPISNAHRSITAGSFFVTKHSTVKLAVQGEFHELQAILGRFRQLIQYKNRELVLTRGVPVLSGGVYDLSNTTEITFQNANLVAADLGESENKGFEITIEFLIDDPVGISSDIQTIYSGSGITAASTTIDLSAIDLQGTFMEQYPIYEITINSLTNGSTPSFTIELGLITITIAQEFSAGDVLKIDTDAMRVTLNDELIDFTGGLPFIADPDASIVISNTLTARNLDIDVTAASRYI